MSTKAPPHWPTLDEQVNWMAELVAYQARSYFTLVETGRMTGAEAARRKDLGAAILATLEAARSAEIQHKHEALAGDKVVLHVSIKCRRAYEDLSLLGADKLLSDEMARGPFLAHLRARILAVIGKGQHT